MIRRHFAHCRTVNCVECGYPCVVSDRKRIAKPVHYCWKCALWLRCRKGNKFQAQKKD